MSRRTALFSALSLVSLGALARAQCPDWQPGYARAGLSGTGMCMAPFDDGSGPRLCVAGFFDTAGPTIVNNVAGFRASGWSALGAGFDRPAGDAIVRALLEFDDGGGTKLYAGGTFTSSGGTSLKHIARWSGTQWTSVGSGVDFTVNALVSFDDGSGPALYAAGEPPAGGTNANLAKWNGTSWTWLAQGLPAFVNTLAVFDDGSGPALYAGGGFANGQGIARWTGTTWVGVGPGFSGVGGARVDALEVYDDGSGAALYAAGLFDSSGGAPLAGIARWNGSFWAPLGSGLGPSSQVRSMRRFDDGTGEQLYIAGDIAHAGGTSVSNIASWDGTTWSSPGTGLNSLACGLAVFDDGSGAALYATGSFGVAGTVSVHGLARWDGAVWSNPDPSPDLGSGPVVRALALYDDGSGSALYVAGSSRGEPARFDGSSWSTLAGGVDGWIYALFAFDDGSGPALFAGGLFQNAGGLPAGNVAKWNGTSWSPLGAGVDNTVESFCAYDDGSGLALYVGGAFFHAGGLPARSIARWNGTSWSSLNGGVPGLGQVFTHSMTGYDDGSGKNLWIATSDSGTVYRWNGTTWTSSGSGLNSTVNALCVFDDGHGPRLFAGGNSTSFVQRWDNFSHYWQPIGTGLTGSMNALAVYDDGSGPALYAAGYLPASGTHANLARWDGATWAGVGAGISALSPSVEALTVGRIGTSGAPSLFVGGFFETSGAHAAASLAEWRGCPSVGTPFCLGDGVGAPCPCANSGAWHHGCENSAATGGARLLASGSIHPDLVVLTSSGELPSSLSIFLQGNASVAAAPFGDGLRCVGGTLKRLYSKNAQAGVASAPQGAELSVSARSAQLGDPLAPGAIRNYQTYYRDPSTSFCAAPSGNTWNISSGIRLVW